jgi:hypothetical protein
MIFWQKLI